MALGKTGDARALPALLKLPTHPSWKKQSLISALAGLKELRDPRGAELAPSALADVARARWVLATPVWDYPLAAAETLAALGQGWRGMPLLVPRPPAALRAEEPADVFYTTLLIAALGDGGAVPVFEQLVDHHTGQPAALEALSTLRQRWEQAATASAPR